MFITKRMKGGLISPLGYPLDFKPTLVMEFGV